MSTIKLYRPVGIRELELIMQSGWKRFPARLEWQPIFYPVLNQQYAARIAAEWNTGDAFSGYCGVVTEFDVIEDQCRKYEVQNVGGAGYDELWVPAEELEAFNNNIVGGIRIIKAFFGEGFQLPANNELVEELKKYRK
ncbi:MAG: ADP-ribosylation/crystallin J1 [Chitinophagaceae bacterium]|nr:ADP-ribosylation/crystallin J1 [Chitinophagaceae bacterium]